MVDSKKRKSPPSNETSSSKKPKFKKQWHNPKNGRPIYAEGQTIEPGDSGIWATCNLYKEPKCVAELKDLFHEYAEKLYGEPTINSVDKDGAEGEVDVEAEIKAEVEAMKTPDEKPFFEHVKIDTPCVVFFRTRSPVEPVSFVRAICKDIVDSRITRTRHVLRLTPVTMMGKANENSLDEIAKIVLGPHFHEENGQPKKVAFYNAVDQSMFAIRPTLRNHQNPLTRDSVIQRIAAAVGPNHTVDLKNYDLLILVDVYKNICGISVVGEEFDNPMKRFNLAELGDAANKVTL